MADEANLAIRDLRRSAVIEDLTSDYFSPHTPTVAPIHHWTAVWIECGLGAAEPQAGSGRYKTSVASPSPSLIPSHRLWRLFDGLAAWHGHKSCRMPVRIALRADHTMSWVRRLIESATEHHSSRRSTSGYHSLSNDRLPFVPQML